MATKVEPKIELKKDDRQTRWDAHVANYIAKNPVKGQAKKARGEFDKIPDTFK